jgi:hypothetical protein
MTTLSEAEGRQLLFDRFTAAGFHIQADRMVSVGGQPLETLEIDGWDEQARIGYEFLSLNDHKRPQYTQSAMQALEHATERGDMAIFVVDVETILNVDHLQFAIEAFLRHAKSVVKP